MKPAAAVTLTQEQRKELERRVRSQTLAARSVRRARIVLLAAEGVANHEIARRLDISRGQVLSWRKRFLQGGLDAIKDDLPRSGRKPRIDKAEIVRMTTQEKPAGATHWSTPQPAPGATPSRVLFKHAHSGDNPEADWGQHVKQAAQFALDSLNSALPLQAPFTFANTTVIAVGVSNGGGAVLRAAHDAEPWLDRVVAISPNVYAQGGRALFDYGTEAALLAPCALAAPQLADAAFAGTGALVRALSQARCANLHASGVLRASSVEVQASEALAQLRAHGWSDGALRAAVLSSAFDLWRAVASTYAAAYARSGGAAMPCGTAFAALEAQAQPRAATPSERALWWSDASGIPPGAGVALIDTMYPAGVADPAFAALHCLRGLWDGEGALAARVLESVAATRTGAPRPGLPVLVIHGMDDGLIPQAFSSGPYLRMAAAQGRTVRSWQVDHAQHFDAFLGFPAMASRYVPLMPYAYRALDRLWAHLRDGAPLPADARITPRQRAAGSNGVAALRADDLALPQ